MHKIAVIGEAESVLGFSCIGIETYPVFDSETAREKLVRLAEEKYGVIYITEGVAEKIADTIEKYNSEIVPAVIVIPSIGGNTGAGMKRIEKYIEKAVGTQLLD